MTKVNFKKNIIFLSVFLFSLFLLPKEASAASCILTMDNYSLFYKDINNSTVEVLKNPTENTHAAIASTATYESRGLVNVNTDITAKNCGSSIAFEFKLYRSEKNSDTGIGWVYKSGQTYSQSSTGNWTSNSQSHAFNPAEAGLYKIKLRALGTGGDGSYWYEYRYLYFFYIPVSENQLFKDGLRAKMLIPAISLNTYENGFLGDQLVSYSGSPDSNGNYYFSGSFASSMSNSKLYLLVDSNPAILTKREPDSREVQIGLPIWHMNMYQLSGNWYIQTLGILNNQSITSLDYGKTYYWRLRLVGNNPNLVSYIPGPKSGLDLKEAKYRRAFITSTSYSGDLKTAGSNVGLGTASSGMDGADKICQTRANAANLGGDWIALIYNNLGPYPFLNPTKSSKLGTTESQFRLVNGILIANSLYQLNTSNLLYSLSNNELNQYANKSYAWTWGWRWVWTGTAWIWESLHCNNWTDGTSSNKGGAGSPNNTLNWFNATSQACNTASVGLYCFEKTPKTIPPLIQGKRVFVTSTKYQGNLGGLTGADSKCQERANAASLGGSWKAFLSDSNTSAYSRLTHSTIPYILTDNTTVVAMDWNDLTDGALNAPINKDEFNNVATEYYPRAWTGTKSDGTITDTNGNCINWTSKVSVSGQPSGFNGRYDVTTGAWIQEASAICDFDLRLYCFEDSSTFTLPTPSPTPGISTPGSGTGQTGTGTGSESTSIACTADSEASARASGLVTTPNLSGKFPTTAGVCVLDPKSAFVPFKIPSFDDLRSLYYDQKK